MKTPSGTLIVIIFAVIAIGAVLIVRAFAQPSDERSYSQKFFLKIGKGGDEFVDLANKSQFDKVLKRLPDQQYHFRFKHDNGHIEDPYHPSRDASLKTDKVTASDLAKNEPPGDPHVTQKVASDSLADIKEIVGALK
jgi:hypothetical protein